MASSLEGNKIIAAVLTAGVLATGSAFVGSVLYSPHTELEENAYPIALPEGEEGGGEAEPEGEPLPVLLAAADPGAGEGVAKKCASCHNFEQGGANGVGPALYGVLGRQIAAHEGFEYSGALQEHGDSAWSYDNMNAFLEDPKGWAPGTKMSFAGLSKPEDRADIIMYLRSISPEAPPPPAPEADGEATAAAQPSTPGADAEPEQPPPGGEEGSVVGMTDPVPGAPDQETAANAQEDVDPDVAVPSQAEAEATTTDAEVQDAVTEETETVDEANDESAGTERESATAQAPTTGGGEEAPAAMASGEETVPTPDASSGEGQPVANAPDDAPQTAQNVPGGESEGVPAGQAQAAAGGAAAGAAAQGAAAQAGNAQGENETQGGGQAAPAEGGETVVAAAGDADAGKAVFRKCQACHVADKEQNRVGPHLLGIVGRPTAAVEGYSYSSAMKEHGGEWTEDRLDAYLADPRGVVQGTKMSFAGLKKEEDRQDVIAYLKSLATQ